MERAALSDSLKALTKLELTEPQLEKFEAFETALYEANGVMNLTRVPIEDSWRRHFLDSLLFVDLIPHLAEVLDIGTGPGFPAWPIANARPDLRVVAIDSSGKMLRFLNTQELPNLETVQTRAESWAVREAFDIVTGRAVAPLATQLEISAPTCRIGGELILMRTPNEELRLPNLEWLGLRPNGLVKRSLPILKGEEEIVRLFPRYLKIAPTHPKFPRPWAEMKRTPFYA